MCKAADFKPQSQSRVKEDQDFELALALSLSDIDDKKKKSTPKPTVRPVSPDPLFEVRAVYDFAGTDEGELPLYKGEIVQVYDSTTFKVWRQNKQFNLK